MQTAEQIRQQIAAYPDPYIFWTQKEIRALPKVLDKNERIKAITSGLLNGKTWLAVCTSRRIIFLNCNMFFGLAQVQMPLDSIQAIDHEFTVFFGSIRIFDGINSFYLQMIRKSAILPFVRATEEAMYALHRGNESAGKPASEPADAASQLTKLVELKEKGYLTDEEFAAQKQKILNG